MKNISVIGLAILALATVSGNALADEAQVKLPANVAACVNACLSGCPASNCTDQNERLRVLEADLAARKAWLSKQKGNVKPQVDRIKLLQEQIDKLRAQVGADENQVRQLTGDLARETKILNDLTTSVKELSDQINILINEIKALKDKDVEQDSTLAVHTAQIQDHESRLAEHDKDIKELQLTKRGISVGVHGGFLGLHAFGSGTDYTGFPITADLTLPISDKVSLYGQGGVILSGDKSAVGTIGSIGTRYHLNEYWSLDTGVTSVWVGFDKKLKAAQASFLLDVGPTYNYGHFTAHANLLAGPAFEPAPKGTSFALGGQLTLGVKFP